MPLPTTRSRTYVNGFDPKPNADDLNDIQDFIAYIYNHRNAGWCGDGSDGDVTLDGTVSAPSWATKSSHTYTMTRSVYCDNLTLSGNAILIPASFRIFVKNTLITDGGVIRYDGHDASGIAGITGGAALAANILRGSAAGADGDTGVGANGGASTSGLGGNGGAGGAGVDAAGTGGAAAGVSDNNVIHNYTPSTLGSVYTAAGGLVWYGGGAGGGAGGGDTAFNASGGGGGGAGVICIAARYFVLADASDIRAKGGTGGIGLTDTGGGGGGGGGCVVLVYQSLAFSAGTMLAAFLAPGGTPGAGGGGVGASGVAGSDGSLFLIPLILT